MLLYAVTSLAAAAHAQKLTEEFDAPAVPKRPSAEATMRIVGGEPAPPNSWPSLIALKIRTSPTTGSFCGATIIDSTWVLTAGHCVTDHSGTTTFPPEAFTILEGTADLSAGGRRIKVTKVVRHPDYRIENDVPFADAALLQLAESSRQPRQVLLPRALRESTLQDDRPSTVAGFGTTSEGGGSVSETLRQVNLPIVGVKRCREVYAERIRDHNICAGVPEGGRDSCQGDSGGPLYVLSPGGMPAQAGIVSWGAGCGRQGRYGVYSAVPDFEPFIRHYVPNATFAPEQSSAGPIATAGANNAVPPGQTGQVSVDLMPAGDVHNGTDIRIKVESSVPGTLILLDFDAGGKLTQIFPNRYSVPQPGLLQASGQIRPGTPVVVPGLNDSFALTVGPPYGENRVIAVIAPPNTRVLDLLSENDRLQPVNDPQALLERIAQRLEAARAQLPTIGVEYQGIRQIQVRPSRPAVPIAERTYRVIP